MLVMRRGSFLVMAMMACALLLASAGAARAGAARAGGSGLLSAGTWHKALEVPGTAAHAAAELETVSCPSAGNCAAGGDYVDRFGHVQALVVTERAGRWGRALEVPGTAALNAGFSAETTSVSCARPGDCSADGIYTSKANHSQMFVVSEVAGRWGRAIVVPGTAGPDNGGPLEISPVSCPSPGNCVAGGDFRSGGRYQAFVVNQTNGRWGRALPVSGAALKASFGADVNSVSCTSTGNCTASGSAESNSGYQLFAVNEQAGRWGQAVEIPVSPSIDDGPGLNAMSCASPGNCAAGGYYQYFIQDTVNQQPFVVSETGGTWGRAMDVPGLIRPSIGGFDAINSVSCAAPDTCTAGGDYTNNLDVEQAFVVSETNGHWSHELLVHAPAALGTGAYASISTLSCTSPGTCAAGGSYSRSYGTFPQAFVVSETNGRWGHALPVPGLAALNAGRNAAVSSISCASAAHCTAVGYYTDRRGHFRAFTVSEN